MGARSYGGASNVKNACNRQTRTDRSRSSEEDNERELTAEGIYSGPFIMVLRKWLTITRATTARQYSRPCPLNMHSVPESASRLLLLVLRVHRVTCWLCWCLWVAGLGCALTRPSSKYSHISVFGGFANSKIKIHHSDSSVNMSVSILRHLELVFEPYRISFEEMKEQYKWLPPQCLCKEK